MHIKSCVGYILQILENSLDVSKVTLNLTKVLFLKEVLNPSLFMLQSLIPKDFAIRIVCDEGIFVIADLLRLQQVILNILTNAFKFAKDGTVEALVSLDAATSVVKIEIRDEGPGVAVENRDKLFSKYGQIEVRQGTGLGLSLSYKLVLAMSGRIYLDATYNKGASFVVELPGGLAQSKVEEPKHAPLLSNSSTVDERYVPLRLAVLLVDDSKAATKLLRRRIEMCSDRAKSWDFSVVAQTGEEALALCRANKGAFDVVVMDQNMQAAGGVLLGHETIRLLREELHMHRTIMIGCSGNADTCEPLFLEAGADGMWTKPTPPTVNMILDLCRFRFARMNAYAAGLPGSVQALLLESCKFFPDLMTQVPPSWSLHRFRCSPEAVQESVLAQVAYQVAIVVDDGDSHLATAEAVKALHDSETFTGFIIVCVDDPEVERVASQHATLVLRNEHLGVEELLLSLSLLLSK